MRILVTALTMIALISAVQATSRLRTPDNPPYLSKVTFDLRDVRGVIDKIEPGQEWGAGARLPAKPVTPAARRRED